MRLADHHVPASRLDGMVELPPGGVGLVVRSGGAVVLDVHDESPRLPCPRDQFRRPVHETRRLGQRPVTTDEGPLDVDNDESFEVSWMRVGRSGGHAAIMARGGGDPGVQSVVRPNAGPEASGFSRRERGRPS